ncbi:MAG: hypothetical protein N2511_03260 [Thermodesulfovibrionales bacterium]|nr:hypothetical protein [Thermodesulfovibrionales bacterium]
MLNKVSHIPEAILSHKIKNRIRIKVPSKKGDKNYFNYINGKLLECNGLIDVKVNPLSGSVLVLHTTDVAKISEFALTNKIFKLINSKPNPLDLHSRVSMVFRDLDRYTQSITGGTLDIADMLFLFLMGLGIYQLSRGNITAPAWYTAFWYAFGIFFKSGNKTNRNLT